MSLTIGERSKKINGNEAWSNYAANKRERLNYTMRIDCEGNCYYFKGGEQMTEAEFNSRFPVGLIYRSNHPHLDSRQNFY